MGQKKYSESQGGKKKKNLHNAKENIYFYEELFHLDSDINNKIADKYIAFEIIIIQREEN